MGVVAQADAFWGVINDSSFFGSSMTSRGSGDSLDYHTDGAFTKCTQQSRSSSRQYNFIVVSSFVENIDISTV